MKELTKKECLKIINEDIKNLLKEKKENFDKNINPTYLLCYNKLDEDSSATGRVKINPPYGSPREKVISRMAAVETAKHMNSHKKPLTHFIMYSEAAACVINKNDYTEEEIEQISNEMKPSEDPLAKDVLVYMLETKGRMFMCMYEINNVHTDDLDDLNLEIHDITYSEEYQDDEYGSEQFLMNRNNVFE